MSASSGADEEQAPPGVWISDSHPGYRRAIESAGSVASPLLAGFSFTLLALLLPKLADTTREVETGGGVRIVTESQDFSAAPEVAAILFLVAGLVFVASVQASIALRYHAHTPDEIAAWFPEYFPEGVGHVPPHELTRLKGWNEPWPAVRVGTRWYGGAFRQFLATDLRRADKWADWTRWLYHTGIASLLMGLALLTYPASGQRTVERWALFGIAVGGVLAEAVWIIGNSKSWTKLRDGRSRGGDAEAAAT